MRTLHIGNAEAFKNFAICTYFSAKGDDIHYYSPFPPSETRDGITYHYPHYSRASKGGFTRSVLFLRRLIKRVKPDLVHAHNVRTYGWMAALAGHSPLVLHAYGGDVLPEQMTGLKPYQFWMSRHTVRKADRLVVTGQHMVDTVANTFQIDRKKIEVISRGINLQTFKPYSVAARQQVRSRIGISSGQFVVLSPRYLFDSVYNVDIVLEAIAEIKDRFPEIILIQMYRHSEEESAFRRMAALIHERGITKNVRLLTAVPNEQMADLYNISDICVSVPSSDGFPVTVLEASACKVPMIATRLAFSSEWFKDGENGFLVEPRSISDLVGALTDLISNPWRRDLFAERNFEKACLQADIGQCMEKLAKTYQELLGR